MTRVLIVSSHEMFGQGVESLLCEQTGLEICGRETDLEAALKRFEELKPDVVVLDVGDPSYGPMSAVIRILRENVDRVIGLNLQDNTIHVLRGEQKTAHGVDDLVGAIKGDDVES